MTDFFAGGAKRRPCVLLRQILSARRAQARLAVGQDEVRAKDFFGRNLFGKIENGKKNVTLAVLEKLAGALDVSVEYGAQQKEIREKLVPNHFLKFYELSPYS